MTNQEGADFDQLCNDLDIARARIAALEAERDRAKKSENTWKEIAGNLDKIHTQAKQRIAELEAERDAARESERSLREMLHECGFRAGSKEEKP